MQPLTYRSKRLRTAGDVPEADGIVQQARDARDAQHSELESSSLALQYSVEFEAQVAAKHDQVERLEDRLEILLERQGALLQDTRNRRPNVFRLKARTQWDKLCNEQQTRFARLQTRLETVREIKESTGIHSNRIDELAARRVRFVDPDLADSWRAAAVKQRQDQEAHRAQLNGRRSDASRRGNGQALSLFPQAD